MYKIDNRNRRAKIKNLEKRLDFRKYNIKEKKQKEKGKQEKKKRKKKPQELLKQTNKQTNINNHPETIYGVCLKKKKVFFLIVIVGYRNKN